MTTPKTPVWFRRIVADTLRYVLIVIESALKVVAALLGVAQDTAAIAGVVAAWLKDAQVWLNTAHRRAFAWLHDEDQF